MSNHLQVTAIFVLLIAVTAVGATAADYYLSPDGDDTAAGSREAPWQSLAKASEAAEAGDTVILLPGSYEGSLRPLSSGTAEAPIVFRAEPRMGATILGPPGGGTSVVLHDVEHVTVEGLHVDPDGNGIGWLSIENASHVRVEDCFMENSTGTAVRVVDCENIWIRNTVFRHQTGSINMARISNTTRMVFEGNVISRAAHSPIQFYPDNSNHYIVMRGNVFHSAWGRNIDKHGTQTCLFEHNIVTGAFNGGWSGSANSKFNATRSIYRFNRIFRNPHGPWHLYTYRDVWLDTTRFYNNVFDDSGHYGLAITSSHPQIRNLVFANNVFSRNDEHGTEAQMVLRGGTPEQVRVVSNVFTGQEPGGTVVQDYGQSFTVAALEDAELRAEHGARYAGNFDADPRYSDPANYNHALREDSPLRNAGCFLTIALGAGEGNLIAVQDAAFFYDGYGIEGEQGDLIAVGRADQRARVIEVDHDNNALRLDRTITWQDGDPVSLPWSGSAPDIGVYEHGDDGRVAVQVVVEPFEVRPGEEVRISAVVHGDAEAQEVYWWLGDRNVAEGASITHVYDEEYDYPIRVMVVDTEGRIHRSSGYVWVAEPVDPSAPLVHSTWGPEDDSSWRLWKSYGYPGPAGYVDVVEGGVRHGPNTRHIPAGYEPPGDGVNYRHVRAPEDGGGIPARIHPHGWDIDRYPEVFVRYRMGEGTPLLVALKPFSAGAALVAINPATQSGMQRIADYELVDNGQWHELTFDVRKIREIHPDLQVLEGLYFVRSSADAVKQGHWYDLDEVIIRPR